MPIHRTTNAGFEDSGNFFDSKQ
jgi:hypothetical protein